MANRKISWTVAMRDLRQERQSTASVSPLYLRSLERARRLDAQREARKATPDLSRMSQSLAYLAMAAHNRSLAMVGPTERKTYVARAHYWLALAGVARRQEGKRLP